MRRLIKRGLMFGSLFHVSSSALVERYNCALEHLTGQRAALTDFYIDISDYSPELGADLGDPLYLNHHGVNRQFILLSTGQKRAPLLDATFSTSRTILWDWIDLNEAQLFALTARDAVAREVVNSVFHLSSPARLFDLRAIKVEADTTRGTAADAAKLARKVDRFLAEDGAWHDHVLIAQMIDLAAQTGDVTRDPVRLKPYKCEKGNFWTSHFGGLYIFQDLEHPVVLDAGARPDDVPLRHVFDAADRNNIARFLELNGLAEPIVQARGIDSASILRQKMDFIHVDAVTEAGFDRAGTTCADMRRHADILPQGSVPRGLCGLARGAQGIRRNLSGSGVQSERARGAVWP